MITEGEVAADDPIVVVESAVDFVPVSEVTRLYARDKDDLDGLRRIVGVAVLPTDWRDYFEEQIKQVSVRGRPRRFSDRRLGPSGLADVYPAEPAA